MARSPKGATAPAAKTSPAAKADFASNYSIQRNIEPGYALFEAIDTARPDIEAVPVLISENHGRGALNVYAGSIKDFDPTNAQIFHVQDAVLPHGFNRLRITFDVGFTSAAMEPRDCNDDPIWNSHVALMRNYAKIGGFRFLAARYVWRLLNGSAAWRNLMLMTDMSVKIVMGKTVFSTTTMLSAKNFPGMAKLAAAVDDVEVLIDAVAKALSGEAGVPLNLTVITEGTLGYGRVVYPSQVFSEAKKDKTDISKVLFGVRRADGQRQAAFSMQKVGNAIRTIDEGHVREDENGVKVGHAIAVEAYGYHQSRHTAIRYQNSAAPDFYTLLKGIHAMPEQIASFDKAEDLPGDIHYFVSMLVRGGTFGIAAKNATATAANSNARGADISADEAA